MNELLETELEAGFFSCLFTSSELGELTSLFLLIVSQRKNHIEHYDLFPFPYYFKS